METRVWRPSRERADLAPGLTPQRRARLSVARNEEQEIALVLGPDGIEETVPLTREILMNPSLDVQVPQDPSHNDKLSSLIGRLSPFLRRCGLRLHSDVGVNWPNVRTVSPDLSIFENLEEPKSGETAPLTIDVARRGCRVRAVFEVVSPGKLGRWKDEEKNPPFFAKREVDDCVLLYPPETRKPDDPPIRVFSVPTAKGYTELSPDPDGFFPLRSIGVRIGVGTTSDGREEFVLVDASTEERLPDMEEMTERAEQAEQLNREMTSEIERLRAQLRDAGPS